MKSYNRNFCLILLISCFYLSSIHSQTDVLSYEKNFDHYRTQEYTYVLQSKNEVDDIQSILDYQDDDWGPLADVDIDKLKRETWCKFSVYNPNEKALSLSFSYRFMVDTVILYTKTSHGLKLNGTTGFYFPHKEREINSWMSYFLLNIMPQDTLHLFARIVVEEPKYRQGILYPQLAQSRFVRQVDAEKAAFQFSFLGINMVFVFIGLIAFFTFKERDFLYYSLLILCLAMDLYFGTFIHHLYLEPRSFWDSTFLHIPFLSLASIFGYLFISNRLELRERSFRLSKIYKWTSIAAAFTFLPFYFVESIPLKILFAASSSIVISSFAIVVIFQAKRARHSEANGLLLSMSILLISICINSSIWLVAPSQEKFDSLVYFGFFGFATTLLFSLFKRITAIRLDKLKTQIEKEKSDELLFNVLPKEIALELKNTGKSEANHVENVSVLFTDFKGFTQLTEEMSANALINELRYYFEAFDTIMDEYGIEKIKTIGDAYMAAGGLPVPTNGSTKNTVLAALKMQNIIMQRQITMDVEGKPSFKMRAGIHTGPVVAGVVGVKKFQYDIWGDTVNTASRIESSGAVGKVNVSQATYELLKGDTQFSFESRGKIEAKGKGEIAMYFVSLKKV